MNLEACLVCSCGELRAWKLDPIIVVNIVPQLGQYREPYSAEARICRSCGVLYCPPPPLDRETIAALDPATRERLGI